MGLGDRTERFSRVRKTASAQVDERRAYERSWISRAARRTAGELARGPSVSGPSGPCESSLRVLRVLRLGTPHTAHSRHGGGDRTGDRRRDPGQPATHTLDSQSDGELSPLNFATTRTRALPPRHAWGP